MSSRYRVALLEGWRRRAVDETGSAMAVEMLIATMLVIAVVVLNAVVYQLSTARIDGRAAVHAAARAASLAASPAAARRDATRTATQILTGLRSPCRTPQITLDPRGVRPGGTATVTLICRVTLPGARFLGTTGSLDQRFQAASPIDPFREYPT